MKRIRNVLLGFLVAPLVLLGAYGNNPVNIHNVEDFNLFCQDMAMSLNPRRSARLQGFVNQSNLSATIQKSNIYDYVSEWKCKPGNEAGELEFVFKYPASTRILAAYFDKKQERNLKGLDRKAFEELQKKLKTYNVDGLSRQEKVKIVLDDLRLHRKKGVVSTKGDIVELVLRNKSSIEAEAQYVFVMMSMMEVPCRIVRDYGNTKTRGCWNMVQAEDGNWYHVGAARIIADRPAVFETNGVVRLTPELAGCYPACPAKEPAALPSYKSLKAFWEAAAKAQSAGKSSMGGVLRKFAGKKEFIKSKDEYVMAGQRLEVSDMYLPTVGGKNVYVRVFFRQGAGTSAGEKAADAAQELMDKGGKALNHFKSLLKSDGK